VPGGAGDGAARAQAGGQTGGGVRALAVAFLARWAEASVTNCGKIAALGGGRALARVAARAALEGPDRELTAQLAAVFGVLARDCPMRRVRPPGRFWARPHARAGAVERVVAQEPPAHGRLGGAAAVRGGRGDRAARLGAGGAHAGRILRLRRARRRPGGAPPGARIRPGRCARRARPSASARAQAAPGMRSAHALLKRLASEPDDLLRRAVLTAVAALAQPGGSAGELPDALRDSWSELVRAHAAWGVARAAAGRRLNARAARRPCAGSARTA